MRNQFLFAVSALVFAAALPALPPQKTARAELNNAKGEKIGSATLREDKEGVSIELNVSQLPPGAHALHIHAEGTALVIHEKPDDYMTDPAGNAGARIACGVVQK